MKHCSMTKGLLIEGPAFIVLSPFVLQTFQVFLMAHSEACRSPSFPLTAKVIDLSISLPHLHLLIPFMIFNGYAVESNGEK